jgi:hypothetical protein
MAPRAPKVPSVAPAPRPAAAVECHTVREILPPWHVLQDKLQKRAEAVATDSLVPADEAAQQALAAQEAANEQWMPGSDSDAPPLSGVRVSESGPASEMAPGEIPDSLLTFKVYTLAELERRSDAPLSMRVSRANFDITASRGPSHWQRVFTALRAFGVASLAWWRTSSPRPNPKVALRQPFDFLGDELQVAVEAVDWKKHGVTTGIVIGATLTLLFAVLTAAELTDDLKPGASAHLASSETANPSPKAEPGARGVAPATNMAAMGVQPVAPAPNAVLPAAEAAPQPSTSLGEIDEPEAPAPKRPGKKKPKTNKLPFRNADAIFNP